MAQETDKATKRRMAEHIETGRPWNEIFNDNVLDVGPGDDPLVWPGCIVTPFDKDQGDANRIDEVFAGVLFDCIHGSQVLEHLHNPADFINRCLKILKPGGWIVMTVPDWSLYERKHWPSRFNIDHKTSWSLWDKSAGVTPQAKPHTHIYVPHWIRQFDLAHRSATLIDTNYDYLLDESVDQTWLRENGVECFIEMLFLKKYP